MLSNENNMINLGNYEEYFILYMDNELSAEEKLMVENFIAQHPHLAEELDVLMSTKLPSDEVSFGNKEELLSYSMKVNTVDEALLLYIDNELPKAEKKVVEQQIASNKDYALQHSVLLQTKLDASEQIPHPNKKELYRHTEKVVALKSWMRVAAAVVVLLFGSLFFLLNNQGSQTEIPSISTTASTSPKLETAPVIKESVQPVNKSMQNSSVDVQVQDVAQAPANKIQNTTVQQAAPQEKEEKINIAPNNVDETSVAQQNAERPREVIKFDVNRFTQGKEIPVDAVVVNKTIAHNPVTSGLPTRTIDEDALETADPSGDFKNTKKNSAKGFFRKVSRFIERNTGIGTANSDEQTLIGAVALKLK